MMCSCNENGSSTTTMNSCDNPDTEELFRRQKASSLVVVSAKFRESDWCRRHHFLM